MHPRRPFERLPFKQIPVVPRRPHPYLDTPAREVTTTSAGLGTLRIHYRETGSGPPLLLIHGLMTTSYSWRYLLEPLGRDFTLIVPDLPGCGRSAIAPIGSYGPASLATWIGDLQAALGIEGCAAIGNSMGGYLCMRRALAAPGSFARLVNIHSPAVPDAKLDLLATLLKLPGTTALTAYLARRDPLRWVHRNVHYFHEDLKSIEEAHEYGDPLASIEGSRAFAAYLGETMSPRGLRSFLAELDQRKARGEPFPMPLQLLYSRRDPLVDPRNGERLHDLIPGSSLRWIEDTSHFAHVDTPDQVALAAVPFLRGEAGATT